MTPDLLRELASILEEMDEQQHTGKSEEFGSLNKRFHLMIYSVLHERRLLRLIELLWAQIPRSGSVLVIVPEHAPKTQREHRAILDALACGHAEAAALLTHEHKLNSLQVLKSAWDEARIVQQEQPETVRV
jgi:DNA-binding GntR family transcriptional regulator